MTGISIRDGRLADGENIARLHTESWQQTYRGLMPDRYLDEELPGIMRARWAALLAQRLDGDILLVDETDGAFAGFFYARPDAVRPAHLLFDNMHVDAALRSRGIGAALMRHAAAIALELGWRKGVLYLIAGNERAGGLYERLGWQALPAEVHEIDGLGPVDEIPYVHDDLSALAGAS